MAASRPVAAMSPEQAELLEFLGSRRAWPDVTVPIERIETHGAHVFLTPDRAWKLRKPVLLPWVDLRSLAARERLCREELRVNRAYAGRDVYLGVRPVVRRANGILAIGGPGRVVDWLVEMRRLPAAHMLDHRLAHDAPPTPGEVGALCERLFALYAANPAPRDCGRESLALLLCQSRINAVHLREMRAYGDVPGTRDLPNRAMDHLEARRGEFLERAAAGIFVDGHGDLRPEHVCLLSPPVIFDRIEFDARLRRVDPFDEINALGLECARAGQGWIRTTMLERLERAGVAPPSDALLTAYGLYRCLTRARLALDHLRDADRGTPDKWRGRAAACLAQARALAA